MLKKEIKEKKIIDGALHGNCKYFYKNEEIVEKGDDSKGKKVGVWFKNEDLRDIENNNE